jgi:carbon storage regulator
VLILTRKLGESVVIGKDIVVTVSDIKNGQIKLGIEAPKDVTIKREEVYKKDQVGNVKGAKITERIPNKNVPL